MALPLDNLSSAVTPLAGDLVGLVESISNLLFLLRVADSPAGGTSLNQVRIVCSGSPAVRAHDLLREVDRYVSSVVDILQGHSYFDFESRSLLLLFFLPPKEVSEDVKWVMMLHPIVLEAIKAMSVVLLALFLVGQNLVGDVYF